jgi:hypothetical protein
MAQYGYSAGYQGGGPQAVPSGFIEAYAQAGRNIGQGAQAIGSAIGESLQRYGQNKEENQFLTSRLESLAPYLQTVAQGGNIMDKNTPESKLLGDIEKFSSMSIPQKKATLLNAEFYLDRADKAKAREMQDLQVAQIKNQIQTQQQAGELMRYGFNMPTTQQVTEPTFEMLQPVGPVQTPMQAPPAPAFNEQGYMQALQQYRNQPAVGAIDAAALQAQLAQLAPQLSETPGTIQIPSLQGGLGGGMAVGRATISETPQQIAGRIFEARTKAQQLQSQLQRAQAPQPTMPTKEQFTTRPTAQQPEAQFLPPIEVQGQVTSTEAIPYEKLRQNLAQYASQQGMNPEVYSGLDRVLEVAGRRRPTTMEQIGNVGTVVRFGDKEQFVPAKETNISDMLKVKGLTIDFPEFRGTAPTEAEAAKFRDQYSSVLESRQTIAELLDIAKMGPAMQQTPEVRTRANSLASGLRGIERINIIGPGTITPEDFKLLNSVIPDPTAIFSLKKSNIQAFETMLQKSTRAIESKAKGIGLESIKPTQQGNQSRLPLASDPRVASIRARMNSGAITRQQATKELQSIQ